MVKPTKMNSKPIKCFAREEMIGLCNLSAFDSR